ncbi:zinc-regulated protein 8-like [Rhododendron vialii]|uniref:zinc-regulated protein 8-like n=1 Tax=Rhododendron vialii TaxID=182163 RepID=UPI00265ED816|nr:zinc-regulated protein 8-like [Rhododendron vialii]
MEKILARVMTNKKLGAPTTTTTTMASPALLEAVFDYSQTAHNNDLSSWEVVNPSSSSDIETFSFDSDSDSDEEDENTYALDSTSSEQDLIDHHQSIESTDVRVVSIDEPSGYDDYNDYGNGNYDCDVNEDEEDYDHDDDYDDELVPRSFSDRFGKQRLMKLGKRACNPKMSNPKKLPCYFYNRPGGVHAARDGVAWKRKVGRKNEA